MRVNYLPDETDITFAQRIVDTVADGGMWVVPQVASAYRMNHKTKTLSLQFGDPDPEFVHRTVQVFGEIGYRVIPAS